MLALSTIRNVCWSALAFGIVACASTPMPVEKLAVARTSIERAEQAQAAQFAQVELNAARSKLDAAQRAVDQENAEVAARMADQAEADAQLAEATARARQSEQVVAQMEDSLRTLREETLRRRPGQGTSPATAPQSSQPTGVPPSSGN